MYSRCYIADEDPCQGDEACVTLCPIGYCRHCGEKATHLVALPAGCAVYPRDRRQWLCAQHYDRLDDTHSVLVEITRGV